MLQNVRDAYNNDNLFVKLIPMDEQVAHVMNEVAHAAGIFVASVVNDVKIATPLSCNCKSCEYTLTDQNHPESGFNTCWGALANVEPHILSLGQLGNVNKKTLNNKKRGASELGCIDDLIQQGRVSLNDIPVEVVTSANGSPYYNDRPLYQLTKIYQGFAAVRHRLLGFLYFFLFLYFTVYWLCPRSIYCTVMEAPFPLLGFYSIFNYSIHV